MRSSSILKAAVLAIGLAAVAAPALADCVRDGQSYPEGTRAGAYVCENGQWVLRQD
jgi:hypothetical protein